jgi:hypothetical protein
MMKDLTVVRFGYARDAENKALGEWLRRLAVAGAAVRDSSFSPRVDLTRNREVGRWLIEERTAYLLMVDADMRPVAETDAVLVEAGDCVACAAVDQAGRVIDWRTQGIPTGCLRLSRALMERMPEPWFEYRLAPGLRSVVAGEAATFSARLQALRVKPRIVGRVGHRMDIVALPGQDGRSVEWKLEHQLAAAPPAALPPSAAPKPPRACRPRKPRGVRPAASARPAARPRASRPAD